jgi:hypothetical protein
MPRALCAALLAAALLAACSREEEPEPPGACRSAGPAQVRAALAEAPGSVRLDGTPLSRCISDASDSADIQQVGGVYLAVATELAPAARARPEGEEAAQLGYLIGAVQRGSVGAQGVHYEMLRRLEQEARGLPSRSAAFRAGRRAGRSSG